MNEVFPETPKGIEGVQILVATRFSETLTLQDLAAAAGMPTNTLTRKFNRAFGTSPMRWLWAFRTALAGEIIREAPGRPLADVFGPCGFGSSAHFSRRFKELFQECPSRYRAAAKRALKAEGKALLSTLGADPLTDLRGDLAGRALARLEELRHRLS